MLFYFLCWKDCRCRVPTKQRFHFRLYTACFSHDNNSVFFMRKNSQYGFLSSEDPRPRPHRKGVSLFFYPILLPPTRVLYLSRYVSCEHVCANVFGLQFVLARLYRRLSYVSSFLLNGLAFNVGNIVIPSDNGSFSIPLPL